MRNHSLLPLAALGLGLAVLAAAPTPADDKAEKAAAAKIAKLIEQLGSDDFDDREKATAALDAAGEPALDALRQAAKSTDEEVRRRAATVVGKIERRLESGMTAKRVHLVYKETPVKDALEDFKKKSGYNLTLQDSSNNLKDRTLTLDTGDVTFWQALDQFCAKAGLKEGDAKDLTPAAAPAPSDPTAPAPIPKKPPTLPKLDRESANPQGPGRTTFGFFSGPPAVSCAAPPRPPVEITLVDGKPETLPTEAATAVRVRALAKAADLFGPALDGEMVVGLRFSLEPKMQWESVEKVR